jgi:peptide-methionine (R)-S-oxide reductase
MRTRIYFLFQWLIVFNFLACSQSPNTDISSTMAILKDTSLYNKLTPEEERVIVHKGTEMPFTGKYYTHKEKGTYICKRCNAPLYRSGDKFESHCGWPKLKVRLSGFRMQMEDE